MKIPVSRKILRMTGLSFLLCHLSICLTACSEQEDEEANEYQNWQIRNDAYFLTLEDSLKQGSQWKKIKHFSKSGDNATGKATDYIYVKVLEEGQGTESPLYNDTIRCSYELRLMPTPQHPAGIPVQQTFFGKFSWDTTGIFQFMLASTGNGGIAVEGFRTSFLYMHKGDRWRVYIPYQLAYGDTESASIPAFSTLIYDIALIDFWHPGENVPAWKARQQ